MHLSGEEACNIAIAHTGDSGLKYTVNPKAGLAIEFARCVEVKSYLITVPPSKIQIGKGIACYSKSFNTYSSFTISGTETVVKIEIHPDKIGWSVSLMCGLVNLVAAGRSIVALAPAVFSTILTGEGPSVHYSGNPGNTIF